MAEGRPELNPNTPNGKGKIVTVTILGNEIRLRTGKDPSYIQKLAENVERRIKDCMSESGVISSLKAVILTCLTLADELEKEKNSHWREDSTWDEKIDKLLAKIPLL
ncbi:MAG TPA: cell division protein ZapA [Candidatus Omnitrophica bacterium]|nr:cell division protein ZapA [Candidatus Omnitrophota bacterium]